MKAINLVRLCVICQGGLYILSRRTPQQYSGLLSSKVSVVSFINRKSNLLEKIFPVKYIEKYY